jgi:hypothetical protein
MRTVATVLCAALLAGCATSDNPSPDSAATNAVNASAFDSTMLPRIVVAERSLRFEIDSLSSIVAQYGGAFWSDSTNASGDTRLCFVGRVDAGSASVVFGASSLGGPTLPLAFIEVSREVRSSESGIVCPTLAPQLTLWTQGRHVSLDISADSLVALFGAPQSRGGDTLTFSWDRRVPGPYRTIDAQKDTVVEFAVYTQLISVLRGGRVHTLHLSHSTTY